MGDSDDEMLAAYGGDAEAGGGTGPAGGAGSGSGAAPAGGAPGTAGAVSDPVKDAEDDAWLAQFRADNAAAVAAYDRAALEKTEVERDTEAAKRDLELKRASEHDESAAIHRKVADEYEKKAVADAHRHDEYEVVAEGARHREAEDVEKARHARTEAAAAEQEARRLDAESSEELDITIKADDDYRALQDAAVAARRIAEDERRVQHRQQPGAQSPGGPARP
jgi:hypothetical protein